MYSTHRYIARSFGKKLFLDYFQVFYFKSLIELTIFSKKNIQYFLTERSEKILFITCTRL